MVGEPTADQQKGVLNNNSQWSASAHRVTLVDVDGNNTGGIFEDRRSYNANGQVEYIGEAIPGSLDTGAVWRIQKRTYISNKLTKVSWADYNGNFDKVWNARTTYDYR